MDLAQISRFERINVVGTSGCGKSTFARELAQILDLPYYEIDQLYWKPNWRGASDDELFEKIRDVTSQQRWVLDGNYSRTTAIKWKQVQAVVWIDPSIVRTLLQVTRRTVSRCFTQQELWPGTGNRESLSKTFLSKDSILWWAMTTYRGTRKRYNAMMSASKYSHITFIRLSSRKDVALFLAGLRHAPSQPREPESVRSLSNGNA